MVRTALAALLFVFALAIAGMSSVPHTPAGATETPVPVIEVPRCPEDAVLVGQGDYDDGRWTAYVCGPALDDF